MGSPQTCLSWTRSGDPDDSLGRTSRHGLQLWLASLNPDGWPARRQPEPEHTRTGAHRSVKGGLNGISSSERWSTRSLCVVHSLDRSLLMGGTAAADRIGFPDGARLLPIGEVRVPRDVRGFTMSGTALPPGPRCDPEPSATSRPRPFGPVIVKPGTPRGAHLKSGALPRARLRTAPPNR